MNSLQYEELCRFYLARELGLTVDQIHSGSLANPTRPGIPGFNHQVDLYWETGNALAQYLNIANAKWRSSDKVDLPEVLLLDQVKQKTGAHKAFMLTTVGFTAGAVAAAKDARIALHIVRPQLDVDALPKRGASDIQAVIRASASDERAPYTHRVEHRAYAGGSGVMETRPAPVPQAPRGPLYSTKVVSPGTNRGNVGLPGGGSNRSGAPSQGGAHSLSRGGIRPGGHDTKG